jgi:hypothetical protein
MVNLRRPTYRRGDFVRVLCVPPAIERNMPGFVAGLVGRTTGRTRRVDAVTPSGLLEFNVLRDGSQAEDSRNYTIWIEPQFVEPV